MPITHPSPNDPVLEALLASPLAVGVIDRDLRLSAVNAGLARLLERDPPALLGATLREVALPLADQLEPALRRVLEDETPVHDLELNSAQAPALRGWKVHLLPLRDPTAGIVGVIVTAEAAVAPLERSLTDPHELKRAQQRLEALHRATTALTSAQTVSEVSAVVMKTALEALGADGGELRLLAEDGQTLELSLRSLGQGLTEAGIEEFSSFAVTGDHPAIEALRTNEPVFIADFADYQRRYPDLTGTALLHGIRANAHLPLRGKSLAFGVLSLHFATTRPWDADERMLAVTLADRAGVAHVRARLMQDFEENKLRLQLALEASRSRTWQYDGDKRDIVYDSAFESSTGAGGDQVFANANELNALTPPEDRERNASAMQTALGGGVGSHFQTEYRLRDAEGERWVRLSGRVIEDGAGKLRLAGTISDITAAQALAEQMHTSEERLRLALEGNRMVTWDWTVASDEVLTSDNFADVYGTSVFGGVQEGFAMVWPEDLAAHRAEFERVVGEGGTYCSEFRITHPSDGRVVWIEERATALTDANGRVERLIGIATEITERKATEQRLERNSETFASLVQGAPFGILIVDADFRLAYVSVGALPAFAGLSPLLGRDFGELQRTMWPEPYASETISRFRQTLATGEPYTAATTEQREDRTGVESYDWRIERVSLPDGSWGVVCYFHDVTVPKAITQRLEQINRAQRQFVSDAAHELRAPLTSIRGNLNLLRRYSNIAEEDRMEMLGDAEREANRLTRLIADLLAVARGETREQIEPERLSLSRLLEESWRGALSLSDHRRFELGQLEPLNVMGEPDALKQLFVILLENAVKYSPTDGRVQLEAMQREEWAEVRVFNDGAGIAADDLERVFERFYRTDRARSRTDGASGTGLGLTIARQIVERHSGRIWLESELGQGTTVIVRLPRPPSD